MSERINLRTLPARDRFEAWRVITEPFFDVSLPDGRVSAFDGEVSSFSLGDALLIQTSVAGQRYERDAVRVQSGRWDQVAFQLYQSGRFTGDYDGLGVSVGAGDLNVVDFTRPYRKQSSRETDINLIVPRSRPQTAPGPTSPPPAGSQAITPESIMSHQR